MRLDHLLSKDWLYGVASWPCVVWIVDGSGPAGGLPLRKGRAADRRALVCGVVGLSGAGMRDTPAAACWVVVGAPACLCAYWGWHAVGVLGQCALVA